MTLIKYVGNTSVRLFAVVIWASLGCLAHGSASAQTMYFGADLNTPSQTAPGYSLETGFGYSVELYSNAYRYSDATTRWGFLLGHQKLSTIRDQAEAEPYPYTATSLQWGRDWLVFKRPGILVAAGTGFGAVFVSEKDKECYSAFCKLPNASWIFTPNVKVSVPLSSYLSLVSSVRGMVYVDNRAEMYPYESGVVFSIGIGLNANPGDRQEP